MRPDVKLFTPEEANALLPRLRPLLAELRESLQEYRFHAEQVKDLERMWDAHELADPDSRDHDAYQTHRQHRAEARAATDRLMEQFSELGIEIKDPWTGLLDFYTLRDGELAYLCWREDEDAITHWHTIHGGYAARQPL